MKTSVVPAAPNTWCWNRTTKSYDRVVAWDCVGTKAEPITFDSHVFVNDETTYNIIPTEPGWKVINFWLTEDGTDAWMEETPLIAWRVETTFSMTYNASIFGGAACVGSYVHPVILEGHYNILLENSWAYMRPDGKVYRYDDPNESLRALTLEEYKAVRIAEMQKEAAADVKYTSSVIRLQNEARQQGVEAAATARAEGKTEPEAQALGRKASDDALSNACKAAANDNTLDGRVRDKLCRTA